MGVDCVDGEIDALRNFCCLQSLCAETYDLEFALRKADVGNLLITLYKDVTDIFSQISIHSLCIRCQQQTLLSDFIRRKRSGLFRESCQIIFQGGIRILQIPGKEFDDLFLAVAQAPEILRPAALLPEMHGNKRYHNDGKDNGQQKKKYLIAVTTDLLFLIIHIKTGLHFLKCLIFLLLEIFLHVI